MLWVRLQVYITMKPVNEGLFIRLQVILSYKYFPILNTYQNA